MTHPRTDRIADLAAQMAALEPVGVRVARTRADHAHHDLLRCIARGAPANVVQAARYRAERAAQDLSDAWRAVTPHPRPSR